MGFKVIKKVKDNPDKEKIVYEIEQSRIDVFGITLEALRKMRDDFQAKLEDIDAKIKVLEEQ